MRLGQFALSFVCWLTAQREHRKDLIFNVEGETKEGKEEGERGIYRFLVKTVCDKATAGARYPAMTKIKVIISVFFLFFS